MRILLIGASHGNELLGVQFYQHLLNTRSYLLEHIDFMVGNPRAYRARARYIDKDLNRSYAEASASYEPVRAKEIEEYISTTSPDLILDMHMTGAQQKSCIITNNIDSEIKKRFLSACHLDTVLIVEAMGDITTVSNSVLAYEVSNKSVDKALLVAIEQDIRRFLDRKNGYSNKQLYRMKGKIYKNEVDKLDTLPFVNFKMHPLGFVPIMIGDNSYRRQTDYIGFKASAMQRIEV